jgi:hypothetical protein
MESACQACDAPLPPRSKKWCSNTCQVWGFRNPGRKRPVPGQPTPCLNCGQTFPAGGKRRYCSKLCTEIAYGSRYYGPEGWVITCEVCGKRGAVRHPMAKTCHRDDCIRARHIQRTKAWQAANPNKHREAERRHLARRTARRRGAESGKYNRLDLLSRDGYRCQLCFGAVDAGAVVPAYLAATIDHIIPFNAGGTDTEDNVWTAHFYCNVLKGDLPLDDFHDQYVAPHL